MFQNGTQHVRKSNRKVVQIQGYMYAEEHEVKIMSKWRGWSFVMVT